MPSFCVRFALVMVLMGVLVPAERPAYAAQAEPPTPRLVGHVDGTVSGLVVDGPLAVAREAIAYQTAAFSVLDLSDPAQPRRVGRVMQQRPIVGMDLVDHHAYIASEGPTSGVTIMQLYDLADPQHPALQRTYTFDTDMPFGPFQIVNGMLYTNAGGLVIYDLQDAAAPVRLGGYQFYGNGSDGPIQVTGDRAYAGTNLITVYDISDPRAPTMLGRVQTDDSAFVSGHWLYSIGGSFTVYDISDLGAPVQRASIPLFGARSVFPSITGVAIADGFVYISVGVAGLLVIDVHAPTEPFMRALYDTPGDGRGVQAANGLAYVADGDPGLQVIDARTSAVPQQIGRTELSSDGFGSRIKVVGSTIYAVDDHFAVQNTGSTPITSTVQILDGRDPAHPVRVGRYVSDRWISSLDVRGSTMLLGYKTDDGEGGLDIVDVADPAHPVRLGSYAGDQINAVQAVGQKAYVADGYGLKVLDISDRAHPHLQSSATTDGIAIDLQVVDTTAYVLTTSTLHVIDIADPTQPKLRGSVAVSYNAMSLVVAGHMVYVGTQYEGLYVVDASDGDKPRVVGNDRALPELQQVAMSGSLVAATAPDMGVLLIDVSDPTHPVLQSLASIDSARWLAVAGSVVYYSLSDGHTSGNVLYALRMNGAPAQRVGSYTTIGVSEGIKVVGQTAYVISQRGLSVFDVRNATNPVQLSFYPAQARALDLVGQRAYVSTADQGLIVLDVHDPQHIALLGSAAVGEAARLQVANGYAYLADFYNTFTIVDVHDPAQPVVVTDHIDMAVTDMAVVGTTAYIVNGDGFKIVDVHDPANITVQSSLDRSGYRVVVAGQFAYVVARRDYIQIIDVRDPTAPVLRGSFGAPSYGVAVAVAGTRAVATNGVGGIAIYDVSDPDAPTLLATGDAGPASFPDDLAMTANRVYVAAGMGGFQIFAYPGTEQTTIPASGGTFTSAIDGISYVFPSGGFSAATMLSYTPCLADTVLMISGLTPGAHCFDSATNNAANGQPARPAKPYTVRVPLSAQEQSRAVAGAVVWRLYWWNGTTWVQEPSTFDAISGSLTATPNHFSRWAVFGTVIKTAPPAEPTSTPTAQPTSTPTAQPTSTPTAQPTSTSTAQPTSTSTAQPTPTPTGQPTPVPPMSSHTVTFLPLIRQ